MRIMFFLCPEFRLMKRVLYILVFTLCGWRSGFAQQLLPLAEKNYTDSLGRLFESGKSDSVKALAAYQLSNYWRSKDTVKSRSYLMQGHQLSGGYPYLK